MAILTSLYPIIVVQSRYGGTYEGGEWHALPNADAAWMWSDAYAKYMFGDDEDAVDFWQSPEAWKVGRGGTPNAAVLDLMERRLGVRQWDYDDEPRTPEGEAEGSGAEGRGSPLHPPDPETSGLLP